MPSFDVVSEVDMHEAANAVDQANREISNRFDFKGSNASFELKEKENRILLTTDSDFQIQQMIDVLYNKAVKRGMDLESLKRGDIVKTGQRAQLTLDIQQGIESDLAKKLVKHIKDQKMKVQAAIQGDKLRVTGKKRDDLQAAIALLKDGDWGIPLQYNNFRD